MPSAEDIHQRFGYHRPQSSSAFQHAATRAEFEALAAWLNERLPEGRDLSTSLTKLQEAMHWANSAIAMQDNVDDFTPHLPSQG